MSTAAPALTSEDPPILVELRLRFEATDDPVERTALRIRQALYLARTHRLPEADKVPAEVRAEWEGKGDNRQALRVFAWLWMLEGVLAFYRTSRPSEKTRLLQAHAAAEKAGWRAERELAAAWLAHMAYVENDYPALLRWLADTGLGTAALDESKARSSQTLACALQWFGEDGMAAAWFTRARDVARRTGDRAGIMAATANRAMLKLHDNWQAFCFGEPLPHDAEALRQELQAILGYEQLSGSASLQEQAEVARVRIAVMRDDEPQAQTQLSRMVSAEERRSQGTLAMAAVVQAWLAGRHAAPAQAQEAFALAQAVFERADPSGMDLDDQASCAMLIAQLARRAGQPARFEELYAGAQATREQVRAGLQPYRADLLALQALAEQHWLPV